MPENVKTGTEEELISPTVSSILKKMGEKKSKKFQEPPVECSNSSEVSGQEHPFVEWPEKSRKSNFHFFPMRKLSILILSSTNRRAVS